MKKGFTLIEMLIVVAIIGLLAGVIFFGLGGQKGIARDAKRIADLKSVQQALELYYQANDKYPAAAGCPASAGVSGGWTTCWTNLQSALTGANIGVRSIPIDPLNDGTFYYNYGVDSGGTPQYQNYVLSAKLENKDHKALDDSINNPGLYGVSCLPAASPPVYCVSF